MPKRSEAFALYIFILCLPLATGALSIPQIHNDAGASDLAFSSNNVNRDSTPDPILNLLDTSLESRNLPQGVRAFDDSSNDSDPIEDILKTLSGLLSMHSESPSRPREVASPSPGALTPLAIAQKLLDGLQRGPNAAKTTLENVLVILRDLLVRADIVEFIPDSDKAKIVDLLNRIIQHQIQVPVPKTLHSLSELLKQHGVSPRPILLIVAVLQIAGFDVKLSSIIG
ncbi:hypothetical protein CVT24_012657 [Panaeolus cyanescens]|uniref:PUL domain-containing protein n=1 Tax=Panaeolus cyanescens TaxID=181874 RepID=A0A409WKQ5_9AGAR|nr:hypothetical protein CVT24_012657 [Panaeolus cyanescens]